MGQQDVIERVRAADRPGYREADGFRGFVECAEYRCEVLLDLKFVPAGYLVPQRRCKAHR
jgi:hypothetical protein